MFVSVEGRKIPKTLLGIETLTFLIPESEKSCRKIPKTLLGIETCFLINYNARERAGKYLKPY